MGLSQAMKILSAMIYFKLVEMADFCLSTSRDRGTDFWWSDSEVLRIIFVVTSMVKVL